MMALSSEQIALLLKMIQNTHDVELTCPEAIAELDKYAQTTLDGAPVDGMLERVREHLDACSACHDELELILETLKSLEE